VLAEAGRQVFGTPTRYHWTWRQTVEWRRRQHIFELGVGRLRFRDAGAAQFRGQATLQATVHGLDPASSLRASGGDELDRPSLHGELDVGLPVAAWKTSLPPCRVIVH